MELPTNTSPTSSTELEQLAKEQTLGEAKYLGCPGFATPNAIKTTVSKGANTTVPTTIKRGQTRAFTTTTPRGRSTIPRGSATALTATTGKP